MINKISSKDNTTFKYVKKLFDKSSFRKKEKKFIVEGTREIDLCFKSKFQIECIFISDKKSQNFNYSNIETILITEDLIKKIIYRESEGVFAIVKEKKQQLTDLKLNRDELILVLENPEKPGNVGAIMRTFEACGFKNIIMIDTKIDIYNPNTIRSSLGAVFQLNVFKMNSEDIFHFLKKYDFKVYGSFIKSKIKFTEIDLKERCALVMGPERSSISEIFMKNSDELISIPMFGNVDSLNLSVSTGIILYEAVNQRKFS